MNKDAYYFSHDSNAKDDPKCVLLIEQLGLEGYGIYWILVETLRDQPTYKYPVILIPALARRYNTTTEKLKSVVFNYGLFIIENDEFFFSESLFRRMLHLEDKREKARIAGLASAQKRLNVCSTDVEQTLNNRSTSKVKESKENNNIKKTNTIDFETYRIEVMDAFKKTYEDQNWIKKQQRYNPGVHIQLSLEQAVVNFWGLEAGWVNKKKEHTELKDWRTTFAKTLKFNKVYLTKQQLEDLKKQNEKNDKR